MSWLLDTNILSELRRPRPEPKVAAFVTGCPLDQFYISVVTLAEIRFGIELIAEPGGKIQRLKVNAKKNKDLFQSIRLAKTPSQPLK